MAEGKAPRAVVIGAGLAGLAAGYRLSRDGWDVLVLEREGEVGGRCRTVVQGGFQFDTGAQYFRDSYDSVLKTAIELGLGDRFRIPRPSAAYFYCGKAARFAPRSLNPLALLPWRALGAKGLVDAVSIAVPLLRGYRSYNMRFPHRWVNVDLRTAADFLCARTKPDFMRSFCEPLSCYALGVEPDRTSAAAFLAALRATFADRTGCFTGGIGLLPDSLAKRVRVMCGMEAQRVVLEGSVAVAVKARPTEGGRQRSYRADLVVCAVPAPLVGGITGGLGGTAERMISETEYSPEIVVNIGFAAEVGGEAGPVLLPASGGFRFDWALTNMSKSLEYVPPGAAGITLVCSGRQSASLIGEEDDALIEKALGEAGKVFGMIAVPPVQSRVDRHTLGRPVVSPGHAGRVRRLWEEGSGIKNLVLAGDWTRSPTVEGAVMSGFYAAEIAGLRQ